MHIGLDVDGVIYPFHEITIEHAKSMNLISKDCTTKEFFGDNGIFESWGSIRKENLLNNPTLYDKPPVGKLFNLDILHKLAKNNILSYITSRPKNLSFLTKFWFFKYDLPYWNNVFISDHDKSDLVKRVSCDIFVDDRPFFLDQLLHLDIPLYIINKPWNVTYTNSKIKRLNNLYDLLNILED